MGNSNEVSEPRKEYTVATQLAAKNKYNRRKWAEKTNKTFRPEDAEWTKEDQAVLNYYGSKEAKSSRAQAKHKAAPRKVYTVAVQLAAKNKYLRRFRAKKANKPFKPEDAEWTKEDQEAYNYSRSKEAKSSRAQAKHKADGQLRPTGEVIASDTQKTGIANKTPKSGLQLLKQATETLLRKRSIDEDKEVIEATDQDLSIALGVGQKSAGNDMSRFMQVQSVKEFRDLEKIEATDQSTEAMQGIARRASTSNSIDQNDAHFSERSKRARKDDDSSSRANSIASEDRKPAAKSGGPSR